MPLHERPKVEADFLELCAIFAKALIDQGVVTKKELCLRLQHARDAAIRSSGSVQGARAVIALLQRLECEPTDDHSRH
jgi:hypothetical protein